MAGRDIKGITIEINGDTTGLSKALSGVNKNIRDTQSQLKDVNRLLKLDPGNTELLQQKQRLLAEAVSGTSDKLKTLKEASEQAQKQLANGEVGQAQYDALQREIIETERQLENLEDQAKETATSMNKLTQLGDKFNEVGDKISGVGEKLLPVTGALVGLGAAGVAAAMELDDGYDTIITKTGATEDALEGLNQVADNVFSGLPISMDQVGIAVGEINTRFGVTGDVLEKLSEQFIKFSEINGTDLNNAIGKVDKLMEQWNIDMSETENVLGLITKKGQDTGISIDVLMDSVQKNGATFKEMGLSMVQSVDLLAQMEANGVNADTAVAGLRKSIKAFTDSGEGADEALGFFVTKIKETKDETEALQIAQEIFGTKGAAEMTNAIREGRINLDSLSASMEEYGSVVEDTFNATLDPWDEATIAMNNLKLAGADLGNTLLELLLPTIEKIVGRVKEFSSWFRNLSDENKQLVIIVGAIVAAIGPVLIIIGKVAALIGSMMQGITALSGLISTVGPAIASIFGAISLPVIAIGAAIVALIAIVVNLWQTNEEFRSNVIALWEQIKAAITEIVTAIAETISLFTEMAKAIWDRWGDDIMATVKMAWEFISTYTKTFLEGIIAILSNVIERVKAIIQAALSIIQGIIKVVMAAIEGDWKGVWEGIKQILSGVWEIIKNVILGAVENIKIIIKTGFELVKQLISVPLEAAKAEVNRIWEEIKTFISETVESIKTKVTEAFKSMVDGIGETVGKTKETIENGFAGAIEFITGLPAKAVIWGKDFIDGLIDGIKSKIGEVESAVKSVADKITSFLHFSRPDEGPLRQYETWMPDMMDGLARGIKTNMWRVTDQVNSLAEKMTGTLTVTHQGENTESNYAQNILSVLTDYLPSIAEQKDILLDGNKLVGGTAQTMDTKLGGIQFRRARTT